MDKKQKTIKYLIIFTITLLLCQNFLQLHFAADTYALYDYGYMEYPKIYFLRDGRLISSAVCFLAGILNIPMPAYIIGMAFIAIIFISIAIYIINQIFEDIIKPQKNITKLALTASCFVLILNQFTLEYLLFAESAIMCLSILLIVLAINVMVKESKHKYIKIFLLLMLSALSYQCSLNIFPVLAISIYIIKGIFDKRNWKIKLKEFCIEMIKLALILLLILSICIGIIKICNKVLNNNENFQLENRISDLSNNDVITQKNEKVKNCFNSVWNKGLNMLPPYTLNITIATTLILLIFLRTKKHIIMQYIMLIIVIILMFIMGIYIFRYVECGRMNEPIMMIWGVSLIILIAQSQIVEMYKIEKIIYMLAILSFVINSIFLMQNITEHIAADRVDENVGKTIKRAVEKYEEKTGITITKFGYTFDANSQRYSAGIKPIGVLSERKFWSKVGVKKAVDYYCERKFQYVNYKLLENIYREKIKGKDYDEFSEEQLIFYKDTLILLVY